MPEPLPPAEKPNLSARIRQLLEGNIEMPADKIAVTLKKEKYSESKPGSHRDAVYNVRSTMRKALKASTNGKAVPAPAPIPEAAAEIAPAPIPVALPALTAIEAGDKKAEAPPPDVEFLIETLKASKSVGGVEAMTRVAAVCKDAGSGKVRELLDLCDKAGADRVLTAAGALVQIEAIVNPKA